MTVAAALGIVKYKVSTLIPLRRLPAAHWIEGKPLESIWILTRRAKDGCTVTEVRHEPPRRTRAFRQRRA